MKPGEDPPAEELGLLVGRDEEKREIAVALRDAMARKGRLLLLLGDPGIGKTRLAAYVGDSATKRGMRTYWGRCWEGPGAPPFWPWLQILRAVLARHDLDDFQTILEPVARYFGTFVPELRAQSSNRFVPVDLAELESEHAQFQLHDSITTLLRRAANRKPLALVLDDLHEADPSSLLLLRFLAREIRDDPILVVGTYRHHELAASPDVAELLRKISREGTHLLLRGLGEEDIRELIAQSYDQIATQPVIAALHGATEGNPFYVKEVLRVLVARGWLESPQRIEAGGLEIPQSVREVIRQRLRPLSSGCRSTLDAAAVIGRDFDVDCLQRTTELDHAALLEHLSEGEHAGIVESLAGEYRRYGFSHALMRETIYADLPLATRASLHHRVGVTLEGLRGSPPVEELAQLAHHFLEGARGAGNLEKAIEYCTRAADHALSSLAYGEAVVRYKNALQAIEGEPRHDALRRCRLLIGLGTAQHRSGARTDSQATFFEAAAIAREGRSGRHLAQAALGLGGWGPTPGVADDGLIRILEEALRLLGESEPRLRVRLLARLAVELYWHHSRDRLDETSAKAVELARGLDHPATLAYALIRRHFCLLGPEHDPKRKAIAREVLALASEAGDGGVALQGRFFLVADLLADGDIAAADREIATLASVAETTRQTLYLWYAATMQTTRALFDGHFGEAEALANQGLTLGTRVWREPALMYYATQLLLIRFEQGRLSELEPLLLAAVGQRPDFLPIRCTLLFVRAELADDGRSRAELAAIAGEITETPRDGLWLYAMTLAASACARLGDAERAEALHRALAPFADRNVSAGLGGVCYGSASRALGLLAMTSGRHDAALEHFTDALRMNERMGAKPWIARTQFDLARLLLAATDGAERGRAWALLSSAAATATALGMTRLAEQVAELRRGSQAAADDVMGCRFQQEGDYWVVSFDAKSRRFRTAKGLFYIAYLLRHPHTHIHVLDLAATRSNGDGEAAADRTAAIVAAGNGGSLLDAKAKAEYRRRIGELTAELEESRRAADAETAGRVQAEIDFIERELRSAFGLGGRSRRGTDVAERVRKAVGNRIRDSLRQIRRHHKEAAAHLEEAIQTGHFCTYAPRERIDWQL